MQHANPSSNRDGRKLEGTGPATKRRMFTDEPRKDTTGRFFLRPRFRLRRPPGPGRRRLWVRRCRAGAGHVRPHRRRRPPELVRRLDRGGCHHVGPGRQSIEAGAPAHGPLGLAGGGPVLRQGVGRGRRPARPVGLHAHVQTAPPVLGSGGGRLGGFHRPGGSALRVDEITRLPAPPGQLGRGPAHVHHDQWQR